jgi:hypothetical protein
MSSVAAHVVARGRGVFRDVRSASGGIVRTVLGLAERAFGTGLGGRERPPSLDEDREAILAEVGSGGERHAER